MEVSGNHRNRVPYSVGQQVAAVKVELVESTTTPPEHYIEGTLLAAMKSAHMQIDDPKLREALKDAEGIGTPATRAAIIERIKDAGYVRLERKGKKEYMISTDKGRRIISILPKSISSAALTAIWEAALKKIENGEMTFEDFMARQEGFVNKMVEDAAAIKVDPATIASDKEHVPCNCGNGGTLTRLESTYKKGEHWWACSKSRDGGCTRRFIDMQGRPVEKASVPPQPENQQKLPGDGDTCPKCRKGVLRTKTVTSRESKSFGKQFLACNAFPKCKHSQWPE